MVNLVAYGERLDRGAMIAQRTADFEDGRKFERTFCLNRELLALGAGLVIGLLAGMAAVALWSAVR